MLDIRFGAGAGEHRVTAPAQQKWRGSLQPLLRNTGLNSHIFIEPHSHTTLIKQKNMFPGSDEHADRSRIWSRSMVAGAASK
jgi:hypothetical protein